MQIFILGAPRSGTTFLASLLESTQYGAPFETQFFVKYFQKLSSYGDLNIKKNFTKLVEDILKERAVSQWNLDLDISLFFESLNNRRIYSEIINELCLIRNKQLGYAAWGDKTPHYVGDISSIYSLFPDAKYLYIVRDGRDVALSLLQKNWGPNNIFSCAEYWKDLTADKPELKLLEDNNQILKLRYEDLLDNTEEHVLKIYDFLGEKIKEGELEKLCSTVKAGNYYKWKKQLTKSQIKIFDQVAANTLQRFGYETFTEEKQINIFKKLFYKAHDRFLFFKFLFEINVIDGIKIRFFGKEPFAE